MGYIMPNHHPDCRRPAHECTCGLDEMYRELAALRDLRDTVNTPQIADFVEAVKNEAVHQRERWGVEHDAGKRVEDWMALFVRLLGKAVEAHWKADFDKLLHHVITVGAVALNMHANLTGDDTRMRPGIEPRKDA